VTPDSKITALPDQPEETAMTREAGTAGGVPGPSDTFRGPWSVL
jgi:hypothetical protein